MALSQPATAATVFLSVQNEREFARFCELVLGDPTLARDPRFSRSPARLAQPRRHCTSEIERVFSGLTGDEMIARLEAADIANARLNSMEEFWRHPQLAARERWASVASPGRSDRCAQAALQSERLRAAHGSRAGARRAYASRPR